MDTMVEMFNTLYETSLTEEQGWAFMCLLKLVRTTKGAFRSDNYEDLSSYAALMGESAQHRGDVCPVNTTTVDGAMRRRTKTPMPEQVLVPCQTHAPATPDLYMCLSCGQTSTSLQ